MFRFASKLTNQPFSYQCNCAIIRIRTRSRNFAQNQLNPQCPPQKPKKNPSSGILYTLGAVTAVGVATIGYAKYDPDFRNWLGKNVPYTDGFFKFIFQEELTYWESMKLAIGSYTSTDKEKKKPRDLAPIKEREDNYTPPRAVFPSLIKEEKEEKFNEIRVQKDPETVDIVSEKPKPMEPHDPTHPKKLGELEVKIGETARRAIQAYNKAEVALKDYNRDIELVVEDSVHNLDKTVWSSLKAKTDRKNALLKEADESAEKAVKDLTKLQLLISDPSMEAPETAKQSAKRNLERVLEDIKHAKNLYETEKRLSDLTERYWKKVETARCHFVDELEILFPDFDPSKKKFSIEPSDLDLFVIYAYSNILYYQKEMQKVETLGQMKLKHALDSVRRGDPNFSLVETAIKEGIEREKRKLADDFNKKCLALRKEAEKELRHRLKCQEQAHMDHLKDVVEMKEQELEREFNRNLDENIQHEQSKYKQQLAALIARMRGMKDSIIERVESDKMAHQSQVLWSACQALHRAVKATIPGQSWKEQMRPLQDEIEAIRKAAASGDELVTTVLAAIPTEAVERGVYPEGALRERFLHVERVARRVALVPEHGAALPLYLLSYAQSMLLLPAANPIPQAELDDQQVDFSNLDTYDILQRARYWLDRGNYAQSLRYMNLLRGASRCVSLEWMQETRILLETQQAAETLMAHAVAGGLLHL